MASDDEGIAASDQSLFTFAPAAMVLVDGAGRIVRTNRLATRLHGGSTTLVGESLDELVAPAPGHDAPDPVAWALSARDGVASAGPMRCLGRRHDGTSFPAELDAEPVPASDGVVLTLQDVSARARTRTRAAAMLDFAPDAIVVVDDDGIVTFANRQVATVFGWSPHELVGRNVEELLPATAAEGHVKLRERFFDSPRRREMGAGEHLRGRRRDGTEVPVEISLSPLPGEPREVMAAIRDVTDRRAAELRARAMLEFAPDATIIVDRSGRILEANRQVSTLFGHEPEALLGLPVEELLPERHRWSHVAHRDSFFGTPRVREMGAGDQLSGLRADGSEFAVEISLSPLPGQDPTVMATIRDVSDRRAAREALATALRREREASHELRQATRIKDQFLDIAAHELRTPLATISGFAEALANSWDEQDDAWKQDLVSRILRNATSMTELTNRLLDVSRLQAGRVQVEPASLDLEQLLGELVSDLTGTSGRDIDLDVDLDGPITTDERAVRHVVGNLLTNAVKYSDPPSVIEVTARHDAGGVAVTVADHGLGIPSADLPHLFEHFFRGANEAHGRGTGVGLSVASEYAQLVGGDIRVVSTRGEGSTFTAWFPDDLAAD